MCEEATRDRIVTPETLDPYDHFYPHFTSTILVRGKDLVGPEGNLFPMHMTFRKSQHFIIQHTVPSTLSGNSHLTDGQGTITIF